MKLCSILVECDTLLFVIMSFKCQLQVAVVGGAAGVRISRLWVEVGWKGAEII